MKLFWKGKDGGPESTVTGYWLIEWKEWFSIALLKFDNGSREAYHSHAFNSISWLLKGFLREEFPGPDFGNQTDYRPSLKPILTKMITFHKVSSVGVSWVLTFRGPWKSTWADYPVGSDVIYTLGPGRQIINRDQIHIR